MPAGSGQFSDIRSENWPLVQTQRSQSLVEAAGQRPRGPLDVQAQASVADVDRRLRDHDRL